MANPFFSGRIPPDLHERAEQYVRETGQSKTDVLINALAAYLDHPVSKPAPTITSFEIEERFKSLDNRVTALELGVSFSKPSDKELIIKSDNNKQEDTNSSDNIDNIDDNKGLTVEEEGLLQEDADNEADHEAREVQLTPIKSTTDDNNVDNSFDNRKADLKSQEDLVAEQQVDTPTQKLDTVESFESLSSVKFARATGIEREFLDDQRTKVRNKYRKLGKQIPEKQLLQQPEEITFKKKLLLINNYPYDLLFLGQDEDGNNLWTARPYDNHRYHQLSMQSSFEKTLDSSE